MICQHVEIPVHIVCLQRPVIRFFFVFVNDHRGNVVDQKVIIHQQAATAPVSIRKRMDVFKRCMKIHTGQKMIRNRGRMDAFQQFLQPFRHFLWGSACSMDPCHIPMTLEFPWPLAAFQTGGILRPLCQRPLDLPDECHILHLLLLDIRTQR